MRLFESSYATPAEYIAALNSPRARAKYKPDDAALCNCHAVVLALPAGNDAHIETGRALGEGKPVFVLLPAPPLPAPELLYLSDGVVITASIADLIARLRQLPIITRIYIASSWTRTPNHAEVVDALRGIGGRQVYDYRQPHHRYSLAIAEGGRARRPLHSESIASSEAE